MAEDNDDEDDENDDDVSAIGTLFNGRILLTALRVATLLLFFFSSCCPHSFMNNTQPESPWKFIYGI